jgi:hypothetical protein
VLDLNDGTGTVVTPTTLLHGHVVVSRQVPMARRAAWATVTAYDPSSRIATLVGPALDLMGPPASAFVSPSAPSALIHVPADFPSTLCTVRDPARAGVVALGYLGVFAYAPPAAVDERVTLAIAADGRPVIQRLNGTSEAGTYVFSGPDGIPELVASQGRNHRVAVVAGFYTEDGETLRLSIDLSEVAPEGVASITVGGVPATSTPQTGVDVERRPDWPLGLDSFEGAWFAVVVHALPRVLAYGLSPAVLSHGPVLDPTLPVLAEGSAFAYLPQNADAALTYRRVAAYGDGTTDSFAAGVAMTAGWTDAIAVSDNDVIVEAQTDAGAAVVAVWPSTAHRMSAPGVVCFDLETGLGWRPDRPDHYGPSEETTYVSLLRDMASLTSSLAVVSDGAVHVGALAIVDAPDDLAGVDAYTISDVNAFRVMRIGSDLETATSPGTSLTVDGRTDLLGALRIFDGAVSVTAELDGDSGALAIGDRVAIGPEGDLTATSLRLPEEWDVAVDDWGVRLARMGRDDNVVARVRSDDVRPAGASTTEYACAFSGPERGDVAGLVVVTTGDHLGTVAGELRRGPDAVSMTASLPIVDLAVIPDDVAAFGVLTEMEDAGTGLARHEDHGAFRTSTTRPDGDVRVRVRREGTGTVWVCDVGGPVVIGDLVTTCAVRGYAARQCDNLLRSCTVAKLTTGCAFEDPVPRVARRRVVTETRTETIAINETVTVPGDLMLVRGVDGKYLESRGPDRLTARPVMELVTVYDDTGHPVRTQYVHKTRDESVVRNVVDADGRAVWEDDPSGGDDPAYESRTLADGVRAALLPCVFI